MYIFAFVVSPQDGSDFIFSDLEKKLEQKFQNNEIVIQFTRKDDLLISRLHGVSFYISYLKHIGELKDWYQMAVDCELSIENNFVNKEELQIRYKKLNWFSGYKLVHYATALCIMDELEKYSNVEIYSFQ